MRKNWIAVASAQHARRGCEEPGSGYMQVCHGKLAPLRRVAPGDRVAYYSPTLTLGAKDNFQRFVSVGVVREGVPYAFDMGGGFVPYRRDVAYLPAQEVSILPLLGQFEFVEDRQRWGYKFRFGLFEVNDHDMRLIVRAMRADLAPPGF
ncbi:MAG: EVE domain-containing protein [Polaromonas sp.]|uniref:EVE domain-containing protein n=1 Tax=Polaromonas sp. TaxID=1869339 RepID=UPI002489EC5C|nr:EVE domain-containing protein [Polaromonas sp.]MDI1240204.1 EVE domain-containing protein [Polaromonas sp.]MDI1338575.1 EVE domain-containing protein [Polaromonas sp.]